MSQTELYQSVLKKLKDIPAEYLSQIDDYLSQLSRIRFSTSATAAPSPTEANALPGGTATRQQYSFSVHFPGAFHPSGKR